MSVQLHVFVVPFCDGALQRSLQECKAENDLIKLHALKKSSKSALLKKKCDALLTILETSLIPSDYKTNSDVITSGQRVKGFMHFQDALDIYILTHWAFSLMVYIPRKAI